VRKLISFKQKSAGYVSFFLLHQPTAIDFQGRFCKHEQAIILYKRLKLTIDKQEKVFV